MDWFFRQWVDGTTIPEYRLTWRVEAAEGGKWRLIGSVAQSQVEDSFMMRVPVYMDFGGGKVVRLGSLGVAGNNSSPEFNVLLPEKPKRCSSAPTRMSCARSRRIDRFHRYRYRGRNSQSIRGSVFDCDTDADTDSDAEIGSYGWGEMLILLGPPPYDVELAGGTALTLVVLAGMLAGMLAKGALLWATRWTSRRLLVPALYIVAAAEAATVLTLWQVAEWLFDYAGAPLVFLAYPPAAVALNWLLLRRPRPEAPDPGTWGRAWRSALLAAIYPILQALIFYAGYEWLLNLCARLFR